MSARFKLWKVRGSLPAKKVNGYEEIISRLVVAISAKRAIELVEIKYDGFCLLEIAKEGEIDSIDF